MFEGPVQKLIDELGKLPGIGPKSAQRLAFHLVEQSPDNLNSLAQAIIDIGNKVHSCIICHNVSEHEICRICSDSRRSDEIICVVADPRDVQALERTGEFKGKYHVLGGLLAPIRGITPDKLNISELVQRIKGTSELKEIVLALSSTVDGETTSSYLIQQINREKPTLKLSRIASGLPVGGDLEYADQITLGRALAGRTSI